MRRSLRTKHGLGTPEANYCLRAAITPTACFSWSRAVLRGDTTATWRSCSMTEDADFSYTTVPVAIRIDRVERMVGKGTLQALVHVTLDVGDFEMRLHGLQITRDDSGWLCKSPTYRDGSGIWRQCFGLPQSLYNAILELVRDEMVDQSDPRNSHPGMGSSVEP